MFHFLPHDELTLLLLTQNSTFLLYKITGDLLRISVDKFFSLSKVLLAGHSYEQFWVSKINDQNDSLDIVVLEKNYIQKNSRLILIDFNTISEEFIIKEDHNLGSVDVFRVQIFGGDNDHLIGVETGQKVFIFNFGDFQKKDNIFEENIVELEAKSKQTSNFKFLQEQAGIICIENSSNINIKPIPDVFKKTLLPNNLSKLKYQSPERNPQNKTTESQYMDLGVYSAIFRSSPTKKQQQYPINPNYLKDSLVMTQQKTSSSQSKMKGSLQFSFSGKKAFGNGYGLTYADDGDVYDQRNYRVLDVQEFQH